MTSAVPRGLALRGTVWAGGDASAYDGVVLIGDDGRIVAIGPAGEVDVPADVPSGGGSGCWVGPGVIDAHVHLAFGAPAELVALGVTATRDLGAPPARAAEWRTTGSRPPGTPHVAVAGPLLTAPGGYPSRGWGADGFARFVGDEAEARATVADLASAVDVVKVALEPRGGPMPDAATVRAVVEVAHAHGLAVSAHALTAATVRTAVDAGVDELAHTPVEPLPAELIDAVAAADLLVVSTLQTLVAGGEGTGARANAAALVAAGVRFVYGTDHGNVGTTPGVDPDELRLLGAAGLGATGALRAATDGAAAAAGLGAVRGRLVVGDLADAVVLAGDPLADPDRWRAPVAVVAAGRRVGPTLRA